MSASPSLGVFRLRDSTVPERLFQGEYPGMSGRSFPPPRAEAGLAPHLPLTLTRFFGRAEEIARLADLLQDTHTRLVTLTGPGGTGKTRLAIEMAGRLAGPLAGAVWFVSLADLSDPGLIAGAVRDALRLPHSPGAEPLEQAAEMLAKQPSLLVLDNFEQFLGTPAAPPVWTRARASCRRCSRGCRRSPASSPRASGCCWG